MQTPHLKKNRTSSRFQSEGTTQSGAKKSRLRNHLKLPPTPILHFAPIFSQTHYLFLLWLEYNTNNNHNRETITKINKNTLREMFEMYSSSEYVYVRLPILIAKS